MAGFDKDHAASLIERGVEPALAIAAAAMNPGQVGLVVVGGGLGSLPDASCVAARLALIEKPTRADILSAIEACSS